VLTDPSRALFCEDATPTRIRIYIALKAANESLGVNRKMARSVSQLQPKIIAFYHRLVPIKHWQEMFPLALPTQLETSQDIPT
jgi:hypothetical protein